MSHNSASLFGADTSDDDCAFDAVPGGTPPGQFAPGLWGMGVLADMQEYGDFVVTIDD
jgi:hypothetical protein